MENSFKEKIISELKKELPGKEAHLKMAPIHRAEDYNNFSSDYRSSAVAIILYPHQNSHSLILIKRPAYDGAHSNQIALPGGKLEQNESSLAAALRETHEEIGLKKEKLEYLGKLSDLYISVSNFLVTPHVFYCEQLPELKPEEREVAKIIHTDIQNIINKDFRKKINIPIKNFTLKNVPYFDIDNEVVWGATALILSEFSEIIQ